MKALLRVWVNYSYDYQRIFRNEAPRSNFSGLKSVFEVKSSISVRISMEGRPNRSRNKAALSNFSSMIEDQFVLIYGYLFFLYTPKDSYFGGIFVV